MNSINFSTAPPQYEGLKLPLVCVTPFGTISILMAHNINIELSVDRSIRVVCWDKFAVSSSQKSVKSGILHPFGHILQDGDKIGCHFQPQNDPITLAKMAVIGTPGVIFSMSHLKDAFLVSNRGTSALPMDRFQFPTLRYDFTIRQFYANAQMGSEYLLTCNNIVQRARYDEKEGMLFILNINGFLIRQRVNGDVEIFCRPRQIICSPELSTVHLRTANVEMEVQTDKKAYVKYGSKRVHVSRSGMVVSNENCSASMDHIGRIVSAS
ncbi:hypothetical protein GPALN_012479 [Globodera pallida]|uniref:Altered inheritance of mitochondria protein 24, mitochondrial n=1 Tax=Globodera rostochiensis TaxID=31243 RepID=A0A914HLJ2_GLORO|nr:hypothetical protein GPALN_012395 [Globodera pallida]KAI3421940.1 hypothetical protein GPALN_012479 [Globodera pallida]